MRFTINLTTRTHLDHRLLNRVAYCSVIVLLVISAWNISQVSKNLGEQSRLSLEIAAIESKLSTKPSSISEPDFSRQKARIRFYNAILERKNINWINILEQFENVTPEGVSLLLLSPVKGHEDWKLEGAAKSFKVVQKYLEKLESSNKFSNILLLSHQNMETGDKGRGVQFSISCKVLD